MNDSCDEHWPACFSGKNRLPACGHIVLHTNKAKIIMTSYWIDDRRSFAGPDRRYSGTWYHWWHSCRCERETKRLDCSSKLHLKWLIFSKICFPVWWKFMQRELWNQNNIYMVLTRKFEEVGCFWWSWKVFFTEKDRKLEMLSGVFLINKIAELTCSSFEYL